MNTIFSTRKSARILAGSLAAIFAASSASAAIVYWDNTSGDGYGVASGTWSGATANWNTDSTGDAAAGGATTTTSDTINFGSTTDGLGAGTITVGTASSGNINFAADSGAIVLSGGTITLASTVSITTNNASNTIGSILAGASTSLTKLGTGTLNLSGANTYTGTPL